MQVSVIVPLFNEEENVADMHRAIRNALDDELPSYEILFVDDGSSDRTYDLATEIADQDPRLKVVRFRRNYGQTPAMAAGIEHASGEILVTLDGDLQNDPRDIPTFVAKVMEGYDLVVGWRHNRQDKFVTRKLPSKIANWLIGHVTEVPIKDNGCSLKAYRASVFKHIPLYSEMHRFIPAVASVSGARIAELKVRHHARLKGESKYGLSRIYKVALDLLTVRTLLSAMRSPLTYFAKGAAVISLAGLGFLTYSLLEVFQHGVFSVPLAGTGILFLVTGTSLVFWGMIASSLALTSRVRSQDMAKLTLRVTENR